MPVSSHLPPIDPLERASHIMLPGQMPLCFFLSGLIMGASSPILAQVPDRGATPSGPVGASMAVLATLQDADVLPPEGTPDANRVIKAVIQFQSVFLKSDDPAVQVISELRHWRHRGVAASNETLSRFRSAGWTSEVLEALSEQWAAMAIDQRERLAPGFRQFNVSPADFDALMELVAKARTAFSNGDRTYTRCLRNDGGRCRAGHNNCNREDAMATKAYILIKVKAGRTKDVLQALKRLAGVEQAHSCFGRPDIILFISVADERALSDVVITKIHQVEGVEETDTHIVADA